MPQCLGRVRHRPSNRHETCQLRRECPPGAGDWRLLAAGRLRVQQIAAQQAQDPSQLARFLEEPGTSFARTAAIDASRSEPCAAIRPMACERVPLTAGGWPVVHHGRGRSPRFRDGVCMSSPNQKSIPAQIPQGRCLQESNACIATARPFRFRDNKSRCECAANHLGRRLFPTELVVKPIHPLRPIPPPQVGSNLRVISVTLEKTPQVI